jgi:hypothetical protein
MLLLADLIGQVKAWQDVFGGGPIAAFLGLMIIGLVGIFGLYIRSNGKLQAESKDHIATLSVTAGLTVALERTWAEHLRVQAEQLRVSGEAHDLQQQGLDALKSSIALQARTCELCVQKHAEKGT